MLATLTPTEYAEFRGFLGNSSGFQSYQYRAVEFVLGNKNRRMLSVFENDPAAHALLTELLDAPSIYDEFLRYLARAGLRHPAARARPRRHRAHTSSPPTSSPSSATSTSTPTDHWAEYEACEELVDLEDNFQLWRFRHLKTVQRTIGMKTRHRRLDRRRFLQKALDLTFFPELYAVRTEIGGGERAAPAAAGVIVAVWP